MFKTTKKFVSIVLIVAMILSNAGMNVLAESFDNEQTTTTINENAGENLFGEKTNTDNGIVSEEKNSDNKKSGDKENLEDKEENEKPEDKEEPEENEKPEDKEEPEESENGEEGSTGLEGEEGTSEETSESSVESTTESSEGTSESSEESSESTSESSEESSNESTSESSEEGSNATLTTDATSASKSKIEEEEKTGIKIASISFVDEANSLFGLENDNINVATDSDAAETNIENNLLIDELPSEVSTTTNGRGALFGSLIDIPEANKVNFNGTWYNDFGLSGIPKDNITKIEFTTGIKIPNTSSTQTWDILSIDATDPSNKKYKILARGSVGNDRWWPSTDKKSYNGCNIDQFLSGTYYNGFPQYYKDNMILMENMEERVWRGGDSIPSDFLENIQKYIRVPMPLNDELDSVYLQNHPEKLANGKTWWTILHDNYAPGITPLRGGSHYVKPNGDYDYPNRLPANYGSSCDIRPLMQMTKDGLKLDNTVYTFTWVSEITNTSGDLMGFAYVINDSGVHRVLVNFLYDDAFKAVGDASNMFKDFVNLTEIKGLDIFDFSTATNMSSMFEGCTNLITVQGVKENFGASVTNVSKMFKDCENIANANFLPNNFGINATNMEAMFENTKLSAWPSKLKSNKATNMKRMFAKNQSATFNFVGVNLASCSDTSEMFMDCATLTTITVNDDLISLPANVTTSTDMFKNCPNLVGGGGFRYKEQFVDGDYASIDFGGIMPGYFTTTNTSIYNNIDITISGTWRTNFAAEGVLTGARKIIFTHANLPGGSANDIDMPLKFNGEDVMGKAFLMDSDGSLIIQFVPQITELNTTDTWARFFQGFENVTSIEGLDLIDTSPITNLEQTFNNCRNLATISIASFKTQNVTTIESAFEDCEKLTHFVGDIPKFNSLVNAQYAFKNCYALTDIKIDPFLSSGLLYVKELFRNCSSLTNIYSDQRIVNFPLSIDVYNSENMFDGCTSLTGGQGTVYNNNYPKHIAMANTDFGGIKPGYFTLTNTSLYNNVTFTVPNTWYDLANYSRSKTDVKEVVFLEGSPTSASDFDVMFDMDGSYDKVKLYIKQDTDSKYIAKIYTGCSLIRKTKLPTSMANFFNGFTALTTISGWDKVDMTDIENMKGLFKDCSSLTTLDLSLFNTNSVTNMNEMFRGCTNLATIRVTPAFVIGNGTSGDNMFGGCDALTGDHGTTFTAKFALDPVTAVDKTFATLDARHGLDGYFTLSGTTTGYNVSSISVKTKPETKYYIGDHFFPNGLVLNVTWDDNVTTQVAYTLANAAKFTFDPDTDHDLTPADTTETVTYGGKTTSFTLTINPAIAYTLANNWFTGAGVNKNTVRSISFAKFPEASPSTITSEWDLPDSNGLKGYVIADGAENDIVVYAPHVGTILGAQDSSYLFSDTLPSNSFRNLTTFNNLSYLVTSRMTDMSGMFSNCVKLQTLNLSSFNTLNVTDMQNMFDGCEELVSVNTSSFNTSKVINMNNMFYNCKKLTQVNTNNFNTSSAREMACMFYECNLLASLDVSKFNTSGVTDMQGMFYNCSELTSLNLGGFNMKLVTSTENMFKGCVKLTSIGSVNLSSSEIRTCKSMFEGCAELTSVNMSNFNTANIGFDGFESMFSGCTKVKTISLGSNFVLGGATTLANMFNGCEALTSINLSSFASNSVNNVTAMFKNNRSLKTIVASNSFAVKNKTGSDMFENCDVLEGGAGTTFAGVTDSSYAQVDEGTANPGYFTWGGNVTITFVGGAGAYGRMAPQTVKRNVSTRLNSNKFSKRGYTFVCWKDDAGNTYTNTIIAYDSLTLTAQWRENSPVDPSGGGSSSSSGGGGGMISGLMPTAPITNILTPKTISGIFDKSKVKWNYDPSTNKFNLIATVNEKDVVVSNGFYTLIGAKTTIVNGSELQEPTKETYYFNATGDMVVGWLVTTDGKKSFAETQKNMSEGVLVLGWKMIDGYWYFFDSEGTMLVNTLTPDGYLVGADGKWIKQ